MRLSLGIHGNSLDDALRTYELLSTRKLSFAPSVLWNGGLANRHIASTFVFEPSAVEAADEIVNFPALSGLWASGADVGISAGDVPATRCDVITSSSSFINDYLSRQFHSRCPSRVVAITSRLRFHCVLLVKVQPASLCISCCIRSYLAR